MLPDAASRFDVDGHLDEATAHAFVDDALSPTDAARAARHAAGCAACSARIAEARGLVAAAAGVLQRLDDAPGGDRALPWARIAAHPAPPMRRAATRSIVRAAAAALVAMGLGGGAYAVASRRAPTAAMTVAAADSAGPEMATPAKAPAAIAPEAMAGRAAPVTAASAAAPAPAFAAVPRRRAPLAARAGLGVAADSAADPRRLGARGACYAIAQVPEHRGPSSRALPAGAVIRLAPDGRARVLGDSSAVGHGSWALVGRGTLRLAWTGDGVPPVVMRRDGAGWTGASVRLTPATACTPP